MSRIDDTIKKVEASDACAYVEVRAGYVLVIWHDNDCPDPRADWGADQDAPAVEAWENGECYGWELLRPDSEHVDSCWGCFGMDWAIEYARSEADARPYVRRAGHYPRLGMAVAS